MEKTRLEMVVGFFVLLALIIFFVMVFFISGVYFFREGTHLKAVFSYSAGIDKGAPVRMGGVRVGEVNGVRLEYDKETQKPQAIIDFWINKGVDVRENANVYILGTYALSEAHLEIESQGESDGRLLHDGDVIRGVDPLTMEALITRGLKIADMMEDMTKKIDTILGDDELQKTMQQMIIDMGQLLRFFNQIMLDKEQNINAMVDDVEVTVDRLKSIIDTIEKGEGTLGQLVKNDELYREMRDFVREIKLHPWRLLKKDAAEKKKFLFF